MAKGQKTAHDAEPENAKLDLSAAQVAGSSLATVAAALLASRLGVYGTILGAGVVSVVATAGGPVVQHFFRRTGDRLRGTARPRTRPVPPPGGPEETAPCGEFGAATVHGTRVRGWKRTAVAAGAACALGLGALGSYEAIAGTSVSADGGTILSAGTRTAPDHRPSPPPGPHRTPGTGGTRGATPDTSTGPDPSGPHGGGGRGAVPTPTPADPGDPTPSPTPAQPTPTPEPTSPPAPSAPPDPAGPTPSGQGPTAP